MKILILSRYDTLGASSRLRIIQYIPFLQEKGYQISVSPLFDNNYLLSIYSGKKYSIFRIAIRYFYRLISIVKYYKYDLLIIEKELFPWIPPLIEQFLHIFNIKYIVDFDDAIFHNYDKNPNKIINFLLKNKISKVMRCSNLVISGNKYIAKYAHNSGAKRIEYIPTVIDLNRYSVAHKKNTAEIVIGWIGSPSTIKYLKLVESALHEVGKKSQIKLLLIGTQPINQSNLIIETKKWSEQTEVEDIQLFDIGIMPLVDDSWEQGKCGYKIIQYMACGIPVIASPVGINKEIINHGVDGYLAYNEQDWIKYLEILIEQPFLRSKFGHEGRLKVESKYCLQVTGSKFVEFIDNILTN